MPEEQTVLTFSDKETINLRDPDVGKALSDRGIIQRHLEGGGVTFVKPVLLIAVGGAREEH